MIRDPEVVETTAQRAAVVRLVTNRAEIQDVMGPTIQELMGVLAAQGVAPAGPLFSHYECFDPERWELEVGVPVATDVQPTGRVYMSALPAARVARAVYQGPYEGLGEAWGEFDAWMKSQNLRQSPHLWERYLVGPEATDDPSAWRTELNEVLQD